MFVRMPGQGAVTRHIRVTPARDAQQPERTSKPRRKHVVQNRISGTIQIEHNACKVQHFEQEIQIHVPDCLFAGEDQPHAQHAERQDADEKQHHHRQQHDDNLLAMTLCALADAEPIQQRCQFVVTQRTHYKRVQNYNNKKRRCEKYDHVW